MAWGQLINIPIDGFRVWNILVGKEILDRIVPQFRVQEGQGQQGFDLGGEGEMASVVIEVKRLFTQAIPCKKQAAGSLVDRKSTRLNSSHVRISYAVFCLKKKKKLRTQSR